MILLLDHLPRSVVNSKIITFVSLFNSKITHPCSFVILLLTTDRGHTTDRGQMILLLTTDREQMTDTLQEAPSAVRVSLTG